MRALLRSSQSGQEDIADGAGLPNDLRVGEAEIDFRGYEARVGGNPVEMTRNEFAALRYPPVPAGRVVTRDDLLKQVWGTSPPSSRTVDNHVSGLRAKLERNASQPRCRAEPISPRLTAWPPAVSRLSWLSDS